MGSGSVVTVSSDLDIRIATVGVLPATEGSRPDFPVELKRGRLRRGRLSNWFREWGQFLVLGNSRDRHITSWRQRVDLAESENR